MASNASQVTIPTNGSYHTNDVKREVIAQYVVLGNVCKVAEISNVPRSTINQWVNTEWGQELISKVQQEKAMELDSGLSRIIENTLYKIEDRVEHGNYMLDKQNEMIRRPVDAKELATVMGIAFDKRQISRNLPTSINTSMDNAALTKLQQQFQQLSKQSKVIEGEVLDNESD